MFYFLSLALYLEHIFVSFVFLNYSLLLCWLLMFLLLFFFNYSFIFFCSIINLCSLLKFSFFSALGCSCFEKKIKSPRKYDGVGRLRTSWKIILSGKRTNSAMFCLWYTIFHLPPSCVLWIKIINSLRQLLGL